MACRVTNCLPANVDCIIEAGVGNILGRNGTKNVIVQQKLDLTVYNVLHSLFEMVMETRCCCHGVSKLLHFSYLSNKVCMLNVLLVLQELTSENGRRKMSALVSMYLIFKDQVLKM